MHLNVDFLTSVDLSKDSSFRVFMVISKNDPFTLLSMIFARDYIAL